MLDVACVLEFFVHGFDNHPLPQYDLVIKIHQGILHVLLDLCDEMDVIHEKRLKKTLADIPLSAKSFPKSLSVNSLFLSGSLSSTFPGVSIHCLFLSVESASRGMLRLI